MYEDNYVLPALSLSVFDYIMEFTAILAVKELVSEAGKRRLGEIPVLLLRYTLSQQCIHPFSARR